MNACSWFAAVLTCSWLYGALINWNGDEDDDVDTGVNDDGGGVEEHDEDEESF